MTPADLEKVGHKLHGRKHWKAMLAVDLGVDVSTIHRMTHRKQIPGPYQVAIAALLEQKKRQDELNKVADKLLRDRNRLKKSRRGDPPKRKYIRRKFTADPTTDKPND